MAVDPVTVAKISAAGVYDEKCRNISNKYRSSHFGVV